MKNFLKNCKAAKALLVLPLIMVVTIGAFIFLMSPGVSAEGSIINVPSEDYSTIQDAIDDSGTVDGDIINLDSDYSHDGTRVVINKNLTIEGNDQIINGGVDIEGNAEVIINDLNIDNIDPNNINSFSSLSSSGSEWIVVGVKSGKLTANNLNLTQERDDDEEKINLVGISVQNGSELILEDSNFDLSNINNGIVYGVYAQGGSDKVTLDNNEFDLFSDRKIVFVATGAFNETKKPTIFNTNNILNPSGEGPSYMAQLGYWGSNMSRETLNLYADEILNEGETSYNYNQGGYEYVPGECDAKISSDIQNAIDMAAEGDVICVEAGTYKEQLVIEKDLSLIGIDNPVIKMPNNASDSISIDGSSHNFAPVIFAQGENGDSIDVEIDGFDINGNDFDSSDRGAGILLEYVEGSIKDNNINNLNLNADSYGIAVYDESDLVIEGNYVTEFGNTGIVVYFEETKTEIINNEVITPIGAITKYTPNGIQISYGATGSIRGNIVKNSRWKDDDWRATAIFIVESSNVKVEDNKIINSDTGISVINSYDGSYGGGVPTNNLIDDNELMDCDYGITIEPVEGDVGSIDIVNNNFEDNKFHVKSWLEDDKLNSNEIKENNSFSLPVFVNEDFDDAIWAIQDKTVLESVEYNGSCSVFGNKNENETITFTFSGEVDLEGFVDKNTHKVFFKDSNRIRHNTDYVEWSSDGNQVTITSKEKTIGRPQVGDFVTGFKGVFDSYNNNVVVPEDGIRVDGELDISIEKSEVSFENNEDKTGTLYLIVKDECGYKIEGLKKEDIYLDWGNSGGTSLDTMSTNHWNEVDFNDKGDGEYEIVLDRKIDKLPAEDENTEVIVKDVKIGEIEEFDITLTPSVLESVIYNGSCNTFAKKGEGDELIFTFTNPVFQDEEKDMAIHNNNGLDIKTSYGNAFNFEFDDNKIIVTSLREFSKPREVINQLVTRMEGIVGLDGDLVEIPEEGVEVTIGEITDAGKIDTNASSVSWTDNQDSTGTMNLNVLDKCGNGIEGIGLNEMEIDFQYIEDRDNFYNLGEGGYWNTELINEESGEYEVEFERTGSVPYTRNWGIVVMDEVIEEELAVGVSYVEGGTDPDPEIHSTYSFSYDVPDTITAGVDVDIPVTFQTDEVKDIGYEGVRFAFEAATTSTSTGDVTFTAIDIANNEYTFTNQGFWGPANGFNISASSTATTTWTLNFFEAGDYDISFSLIDANNNTVVDGIEDSVLVSVVEPVTEPKTEPENNVRTFSSGGGTAGGGNYCSSVEYGDWTECENGFQYREILSKNSDYCSLTTEQQLDTRRECSEGNSGSLTPEVLGDTDYADGTLLKGGDDRIFVVFGDYIYHIKNAKELSNYQGPILLVGNEVISSFVKVSKDGIPSKYKDVLGDKTYVEGTLIRAKGDIKIYVIKDGKKVHIKSPEELKDYLGPILIVDADELNNY